MVFSRPPQPDPEVLRTGKFHWTLPIVLERITLVLIIIISYAGYFGINMWLEKYKSHFYDPAFWLDHAIPFSKYWIVIYLGLYIVLFAPAFVIRDRYVFRQVALTYLLTHVASWVLFLIYPVKLHLRPNLSAFTEDYFIWLVKLTYHLDPPNCTFPSMHVAMAAVAAMGCWKVDRYIGNIALTFTGMIAVSTLFVKQHYISDVIMGYVLAYLAYYFVLRFYPIKGIPTTQLRMPHYYSVFLAVIYALCLIGLGVAYASGWTPWKG